MKSFVLPTLPYLALYIFTKRKKPKKVAASATTPKIRDGASLYPDVFAGGPRVRTA